jgi:hypothetical protein
VGQHARIILLPLIVILVEAAIIVGIGNILLSVSYAMGKMTAVWTALGIALVVLAVCTFLGTRTQENEGLGARG